MMNKEVKSLIKQHISEIDKDNYTNIIVAAAEKGFECVVELRKVFQEAKIDIDVFDEQFVKMLVGYKEISRLAQEMIKITK